MATESSQSTVADGQIEPDNDAVNQLMNSEKFKNFMRAITLDLKTTIEEAIQPLRTRITEQEAEIRKLVTSGEQKDSEIHDLKDQYDELIETSEGLQQQINNLQEFTERNQMAIEEMQAYSRRNCVVIIVQEIARISLTKMTRCLVMIFG